LPQPRLYLRPARSALLEPDFSRRFPAKRLAAVTLTLRDGTRLCSGPTTPRGAALEHDIGALPALNEAILAPV
jgi:hypothetical protein